MRTVLILPVLASLALVAACSSKEADKAANAQGEVLPGSISDAMLPEDRVTSQPPLDPGAVRGKATGAPEAKASGETTAPDEAAAAPATAAAAAE